MCENTECDETQMNYMNFNIILKKKNTMNKDYV